jgi:hypothetical protein
MQIKANGFGLELTDAMLPALQSILNEFSKLFDSKNDWTALFEVIKVGLKSIATVIYATIKLVDQLAKVAIYSFNAIDKALKGDYTGAGKALSKGFTSGIGQAQEDFKAIQRMWTDAPSPGTGRRTGGTAADLSAMGVAGAGSKEKSAAAQIAVALKSALGITDAQAAGIVGNLMRESGLNPRINEGGAVGLPREVGGYGLAQWTGSRQSDLIRFAGGRGRAGNMETQLRFLVSELMGPESKSLTQLKTAQSPEQAAYLFDKFYERSGVKAMGERKANARQVFGEIAGRGPSAGLAEYGQQLREQIDANAKITKETEKQLTNAKDLLDKNLSTFQILQAETPLQKLAAEYDEKRANRMREYAEKYKSALSDQETQTLISAQSLDALNSEMNYAIQASQLVAEQISVIDNGLIGFTSMLSETSPIIENIASTIGSGIGSAIDSLITGTKSWGDSLREIGSSVLKDIAKQLLQMSVVGPATKGIGNLLGSLFPAAIGAIVPGISAAGGPAFGMNGASVDVNQAFKLPSLMANGGIMTPMGPMPLKRYANGGVANSPQMAVYGEGSRPEAFVPLPDGRRIPVKLDAAGALGRYPRLDAGGNSGDTATGAGADNNTVLAMNFETTQFLGQDWVSKDQLMAAMAATEKRATAAGAKAGAQQVASKMRTSPAFRRQVGVK